MHTCSSSISNYTCMYWGVFKCHSVWKSTSTSQGCLALEFGIGVKAVPLGCEPSSLPFTYLGVSVGANMKLKKHWKPIIDRFYAKLSPWKAKTLSFGGILTLVKAVLGSLSSYFLSIFVAPVGVIEILEKIWRQFLWGGGDNNHKI